jgi:DNA end-binding protein Ku
MRSIWSGSLSFGLVNIPVKLYVATEDNGLDLTMLHKDDLSPVRFARFCKKEEKEIPYQEITRGFEVESGEYVVISEEDFAKATVKRTKSIEILNFVKEEEIDSVYFEKPYYLEPAKGSEKSYALLAEALKKSKTVGIAKFVLRAREHLALIKPSGNALILNQMRFSDEIRDMKDLEISKNKAVTEKELAMALAFIEQLTEKFTPENYKDTYIAELHKIIDAKRKGKTVKIAKDEPIPTKVEDLMTLLKKSLEQQERQPYAN